MLHALEARAGFQVEAVEVVLGRHEDADGRCVHGRHVRFLADCGETPLAELQAAGAVQAQAIVLHDFDAPLVGIDGEARGDFAVRFDLHVGVVVAAEADVQRRGIGEGLFDASLEVEARLLQVQGHVAFFLVLLVLVVVFVLCVLVFVRPFVVVMLVLVLVFVAVRVGVAAGQSVVVLQLAERDADEAALADPGRAERAALAFGLAAGQVPEDFLVLVLVLVFVVVFVLVVVVFALFVLVFVVMLFLFLGGAKAGGFGEAGNVVFVRRASECVEVPGELAAAAIEPQHGAALVAVVGAAHDHAPADAVGRFVRNAPGLHIDNAADGAGAVQQYARALEHFHAVGDGGINGHRVVAAGDGDVHGVDAVFHDAHARAAQAVHHRPPHRGAEGCRVDARLPGHGFADVVGEIALKLRAVENHGRLGKPSGGKRVGDDENFFEFGIGGFCRRVRRLFICRRSGDRGVDQREQRDGAAHAGEKRLHWCSPNDVGSWRRSPRNRWPARFRVNGRASADLSASRGAACGRPAAQAERPSPARCAARPAVSPRTAGRRRLRSRRRRRVNRPPPLLRHRGCDALPRQPPCASPWPQARPRQPRLEHALRLVPFGFAASSWLSNRALRRRDAFVVFQLMRDDLFRDLELLRDLVFLEAFGLHVDDLLDGR